LGGSVYTSLLIKDFRRKAGNIKAIRKDLRDLASVVIEMEKEQAALLTIIQSREPDFLPSSVKAIATAPKVLGLPWNRLSLLVLEAIKNSDTQPVSAKDISNYVIINGPIEIENRRAYAVINKSVRDSLRRLRRKGKVISFPKTSNNEYVLWQLASPE